MTKVLMPLASAVTLETSPDGKQTGVFFKVPGDPGFIGVAVANNELSRLAELLIDQAGRVAAANVPERPPAAITAKPILVSHMGIAQGRSNTEALLAFRVGNLDLTFAVDVSMIRGQCEYLLSMTGKTALPPKQ